MGTCGKAPPAAGRCARPQTRRVSSLAGARSGIHLPVCPTAIDRARAVSQTRAQVLRCPAAGGESSADRSSASLASVSPQEMGHTGNGLLQGSEGGERREGGAWGRSGPGFGEERGEGPRVTGGVWTPRGATVGPVGAGISSRLHARWGRSMA